MIRHTFKKAQRLKSEKIIRELFEKGSSFYSYPIKLFYLPKEEQPTQVLFTVPKKRFKKAVDRNKIRRRLREAYRLSQHQLPENPAYYLAFVYIADKQETFDLIHSKLKKIIYRLDNEKK